MFNKLASEPYFAAISLFQIRKERFQSEIEEALSSRHLRPRPERETAGRDD